MPLIRPPPWNRHRGSCLGLGVVTEKARTWCCTRWSQGQPAPGAVSDGLAQEGGIVDDNAEQDEKELWLKFLRVELEEQCKLRGLSYSGTKAVLADRLIRYDPIVRPPSTAKHVKYLLELENRSGIPAGVALQR